MGKNTSAHIIWECQYHILFAPEYRRQVIYGKIKNGVGKIYANFTSVKIDQ